MSKKTVSITLSAELADIMRLAVINRCGQLQDHMKNLCQWREMAEYIEDTDRAKKHRAEIKDAQVQLAGLREIYRILETARLGGTEDTEEEDMIRMEASEPVLSQEDYRDIYRYLMVTREILLWCLEEAGDVAKEGQRNDDTACFCVQKASSRITELMHKVAQEAGLDEPDEKEGASVSRMVMNTAAKKTPPPEAKTPETAQQSF